jgi:hypothetical protein
MSAADAAARTVTSQDEIGRRSYIDALGRAAIVQSGSEAKQLGRPDDGKRSRFVLNKWGYPL